VKRSSGNVSECASAEPSVAHCKRSRPSDCITGGMFDFDGDIFNDTQEEALVPLPPVLSDLAATSDVQENAPGVGANASDLIYLTDESLFCELSGDFEVALPLEEQGGKGYCRRCC